MNEYILYMYINLEMCYIRANTILIEEKRDDHDGHGCKPASKNKCDRQVSIVYQSY